MAKFHEDKVYGMKVRESADDGSDFSNPDADYRLMFVGEDGDIHLKDSAGTVTDFPAGGGGGGSLTSSQAFLTSNVSLSSADTFFDGPSLSLAAGDWLVSGILIVSVSGAVSHIEGKMWDGTNVFGETEGYSPTAGSTQQLSFPGTIVTLGGTTTVKLSAARDVGSGGTILDQLQVNGTADKASRITAVKIA